MMVPEKHPFTNGELADIFNRIASLLEIKGEVVYKTLAYRKVAGSLRELPEDINVVHQEGRLKEIPGVGKAISEKIDELLTSGRLGFLEKVEAEVPPTLVALLEVPDLGPKKIALFWKEAGITNLAQLQEAARAGRLRTLPGMGEKSEARLLAGIEALSRRSTRMLLGAAWPVARRWLETLRGVAGVERIEAAGSLRRWRVTIGDIDLVAATNNAAAVMEAFIRSPEVARVLGQGENKSSIETHNGLKLQLWTQPPERFGSLLQFVSGSKDHNVRLRELAQKQGLSLSERGLVDEAGKERYCATEEELYAALGLAYIPPELREDRGEIQAARAGKLPELVAASDIRAELHSHSTWSDGAVTIREMALAARQRGLSTLAITDHTHSLGIASGMHPEDVLRQRAEIDDVQRELGNSIRILQGAEVEIRADGSLDYPDELLASLDIVIASLHISLRQPRQVVTDRVVSAIRNPHVDIIAHPSGRLLPNRAGADLDYDAVLSAAKEHDTALEINASPSRLDLDEIYVRRAAEMGIPLAINTDAHAPDQLDLMEYGVSVARRAWVGAEKIINTWSAEKIAGWLQERH
ncbi:MAG TPA: DNA polymerase/3'-5' exonuclease PolX [Levilinea sp.]|nr:DNA polymerase/3'-5' exonuclease PolX [Levilinea sp.]